MRLIAAARQRTTPAATAPLLEVLTRRYYGNRELPEPRPGDGGLPFVTADYDRDGGASTSSPGRAARRAARAAATIAAAPSPPVGADGGRRRRPGDLAARREPDADASRRPGAARRATGRPLHRLDSPDDRRRQRRRSVAPPLHLPARRTAGFVEDRLIRGLHPLIAQRLQLWRLREFDLTRLRRRPRTSTCSRAWRTSNPADERLSRWPRSAT